MDLGILIPEFRVAQIAHMVIGPVPLIVAPPIVHTRPQVALINPISVVDDSMKQDIHQMVDKMKNLSLNFMSGSSGCGRGSGSYQTFEGPTTSGERGYYALRVMPTCFKCRESLS